VAAVLVLTKAVKGTSLAPLRVYLWAAGSAFVTWRITSTTVRRLVRLKAHVCLCTGVNPDPCWDMYFWAASSTVPRLLIT
jgi:hypothetical protein